MHLAFTRAYTQRELDYIRANWQSKSCAEMASELGRSERGIYKKIRDMHLRDASPPKGSAPMQKAPLEHAPIHEQTSQGAPRSRSDAEWLAELRDLIWRNLQDAEPVDVARLAPEFRKTLAEMGRAREVEGGTDEQGGGDSLADVISLVP